MDTDKLDVDELVKCLQDVTECPVCLHPLRPETVMCVNGHVMCHGCRGDQGVCPTCRKVFADVQQLTFVEQIPRVVPWQCRFNPCGADVRAETDHDKYCGFRPTRCRGPSCEWEGPCRELGEHYQTHRRSSRTLFGSYFCSDTPFNEVTNFLGVKLCSIPLKELLWIELKYDPNIDTTISFFPVLLEKSTSDVTKLTVSFESGLLGLKSVFKIQLNLDDEMSWQDNRITVSSTMFRQFHEKRDSEFKIS